MTKFILALLPTLLTFGPLLASGIGGMLYDDPSWYMSRAVPLVGALMTGAGLGIVIRLLHRQSREISRLAGEVRRLTTIVRHSRVDYRIHRDQANLEGTGYMEIGPGKYSGKHWQNGFVFVWGDAFGMAEGILAKYVANYDHFSMTDIPKDVGMKVIAEWQAVAARLRDMSSEQAQVALNLSAAYRDRLEFEIPAHRDEIASMLRKLAEACSFFYEREDWVCVLGM
jgi:hypothetical protein